MLQGTHQIKMNVNEAFSIHPDRFPNSAMKSLLQSPQVELHRVAQDGGDDMVVPS